MSQPRLFVALSALAVSVLGCSSSEGESSGTGGHTASGGSANGGSSARGGSGNGGSSSGGNASGGSASSGCPNLAGTWTVKTHCQQNQVGKSVSVTQTGCMATVPSFNFSGNVGPNGELNLSGGGITCTGSATSSLITEQCTVLGQPCSVSLTR